jgi:hypothetical protein
LVMNTNVQRDKPENLPFGLTRQALKFMLFFACIFLWALFFSIFDGSRGSWPTADGHILESKLVEASPRTIPPLLATYEYSVGGKPFTGSTSYDPGPDQPSLDSLKPHTPVKVYFNQLIPSQSTISPGSQSRLHQAVMLFAILAIIVMLFARPDLSGAREVRSELPEFIDALASLVQAGESVPTAIEQVCDKCAMRCPRLSTYVSKAVQKFKLTRTPIYETLRLNGESLHIDELVNFASTLAAASKTGGSVVEQLRHQSDSLRHRLESEKIAATNVSRNFSGERPVVPDSLLEARREEDDRPRL